MVSKAAINFTEINQSSTSLFKGKTQQVIFVIINIISALISTILIINAIIFNMPLLCLGLIFLFSIVLFSAFLLSNLSKQKILLEEKPNNITNLFTPKTIFLTNISTKINKKTTQIQALKTLQKLEREVSQKIADSKLPKIKRLKGDFILPPTIPKENKSTAIVSFLDLNSALIAQQNVTERSWKSAHRPSLPQGAASSGYIEYKKPEYRTQYSFVRLLIQAKGILVYDDYDRSNFIKILKTTYLNTFTLCEEEGIKIVQIPSSGYCLTSDKEHPNDQNLAAIFNKIAFSEALLSFSFSSIKTIYFVLPTNKQSLHLS